MELTVSMIECGRYWFIGIDVEKTEEEIKISMEDYEKSKFREYFGEKKLSLAEIVV